MILALLLALDLSIGPTARSAAPSDDPSDACAAIAAHPAVRSYVSMLTQAQAIDADSLEWPAFDTADQLLGQWVAQQVTRNPSQYQRWLGTVNKCAHDAKGTQLLVFYEPSPGIRKYLESRNPMRTVPARRTIDAQGNISTRPAEVSPPENWAFVDGPGSANGSTNYFWRCHQGGCPSGRPPRSNLAAALAFTIPGGVKVLESLGDEPLAGARRRLQAAPGRRRP